VANGESLAPAAQQLLQDVYDTQIYNQKLFLQQIEIAALKHKGANLVAGRQVPVWGVSNQGVIVLNCLGAPDDHDRIKFKSLRSAR
jgi:hypothetical protein